LNVAINNIKNGLQIYENIFFISCHLNDKLFWQNGFVLRLIHLFIINNPVHLFGNPLMKNLKYLNDIFCLKSIRFRSSLVNCTIKMTLQTSSGLTFFGTFIMLEVLKCM